MDYLTGLAFWYTRCLSQKKREAKGENGREGEKGSQQKFGGIFKDSHA